MLEVGRLFEAELVSMLMNPMLGTAFFFLPAVATAFAGRDVWMTPLAATADGLLVALFTGYLSSQYPGFNFFHWTEIILGKVGGEILQFLYLLWFIHVTSVILNEFNYFVKIAFMTVTPAPGAAHRSFPGRPDHLRYAGLGLPGPLGRFERSLQAPSCCRVSWWF